MASSAGGNGLCVGYLWVCTFAVIDRWDIVFFPLTSHAINKGQKSRRSWVDPDAHWTPAGFTSLASKFNTISRSESCKNSHEPARMVTVRVTSPGKRLQPFLWRCSCLSKFLWILCQIGLLNHKHWLTAAAKASCVHSVFFQYLSWK